MLDPFPLKLDIDRCIISTNRFMFSCDLCVVNFVCYSVPGTFSVFFDRKTFACVIKGNICRFKKNRSALHILSDTLLTVYNYTR